MKSTGNDIVALNAIDIQRTNTPAFYLKIITPAEHALYSPVLDARFPFQNFVWLLWSVKESVYKYLKRIDNDLVFSPTKIVIQNVIQPTVDYTEQTGSIWESTNDDEQYCYTGEVVYNTHKLYFRSYITEEVIATVVHDTPGFKNVHWGFRSIDHNDNISQSKKVREFAVARLQAILKTKNLQIQKDATGVPVIFDHTDAIDVPISLAHHDHFVSYSYAVR